MSGNILITGATGGLGNLTIDYLFVQKNIPVNTIFAMVRDAKNQNAIDYGTRGINIRIGDFNDPKSLTTALTGIQTLLLISSNVLEKRYQQHSNVIKAAKECGIKHIVYTSILKCSKDSKFELSLDHFLTEELLKQINIPYTIFRNSYYMEIITNIINENTKTSGKWNYPIVGKIKINCVCKSDIGEGLAHVLVDLKTHVNKIYEIASWKSYTFIEITNILSKIFGKTITYVPITMDEYKIELKTIGMLDSNINHFVGICESIIAGQFDINDNSLEKILGHKTKTMEEYLPILFKK